MAKKKQEKPVFPVLIDITNKEQLKWMSMDDLIADAAERGDVEALAWLAEKNTIKQTRHATKNGVKGAGKAFTVGASTLKVRCEYFEKFLGWKPEKDTAAPAPTLEEKQAERANKIKEAMAKAAAAAVAANNAKKK